jgi:hypothetical protein
MAKTDRTQASGPNQKLEEEEASVKVGNPFHFSWTKAGSCILGSTHTT